MKRTTYNTVLVQDRTKALIKRHGGTRAASRALKIDPSYVSRLSSGEKKSPNDRILKRLGLVRMIAYVDDGQYGLPA